jgi:hypothetical protein
MTVRVHCEEIEEAAGEEMVSHLRSFATARFVEGDHRAALAATGALHEICAMPIDLALMEIASLGALADPGAATLLDDFEAKVKAARSKVELSGDEQAAIEDALVFMRAHFNGGARSEPVLDKLKDDAARWIPRLNRNERGQP